MATHRGWQKQDLFLNVGGQIQQVHNLRDAGTADLTQTSQGRVVRNHSLA